MTLRDSCNVRRLSILAGASKSRGRREGAGLYLRLGALTSLHSPSLFLFLFSCLSLRLLAYPFLPPLSEATTALLNKCNAETLSPQSRNLMNETELHVACIFTSFGSNSWFFFKALKDRTCRVIQGWHVFVIQQKASFCVFVCACVFGSRWKHSHTPLDSRLWLLNPLWELPCVIQTFRANLSMQAGAASFRKQQLSLSLPLPLPQSLLQCVYMCASVWLNYICVCVCVSSCRCREMKALNHSPVRVLQILSITHTHTYTWTHTHGHICAHTLTPEGLTGLALYWLPWSGRQQIHLIEAAHTQRQALKSKWIHICSPHSFTVAFSAHTTELVVI